MATNPWLFTPEHSQESQSISRQSSFSQKTNKIDDTREILGIIVAHGSKYVNKEMVGKYYRKFILSYYSNEYLAFLQDEEYSEAIKMRDKLISPVEN